MTHEDLTVRVELLEERPAKPAGSLIVLREAIDDGTLKAAAPEMRKVPASDPGDGPL